MSWLSGKKSDKGKEEVGEPVVDEPVVVNETTSDEPTVETAIEEPITDTAVEEQTTETTTTEEPITSSVPEKETTDETSKTESTTEATVPISMDFGALFDSILKNPTPSDYRSAPPQPPVQKKQVGVEEAIVDTLISSIPLFISALTSGNSIFGSGSSSKSKFPISNLVEEFNCLWSGLDRMDNKSVRAICFVDRLSKFHESLWSYAREQCSKGKSDMSSAVLDLSADKLRSELINVMEQLNK